MIRNQLVLTFNVKNKYLIKLKKKKVFIRLIINNNNLKKEIPLK